MSVAAIMHSVIHQTLQQQLAPEYPLSSEQDCIDLGAHAPHHPFASGAVPDQLRREGVLNQSAAHSFSVSSGSTPTRYMSQRVGAAPEAQYQTGSGISDSYSNSISTSPSSNASSIAALSPFSTSHVYPQYTQPGLGVGSTYSSNSQLFANIGQPFNVLSGVRTRVSSITDPSPPTMLPPARTSGMGNPVSPSLGPTARDNYTTSTPHLSRHTHTLSPRSHAESLSRSSFGTHTDTPRSVSTMALSPASNHYDATSAMLSYQPSARQPETPPFSAQETFVDISCNGETVVPSIEAKIEKGFFYSQDRTWTCYRRNYFSVLCSFTLSPVVPNGRLYLTRPGKSAEMIQATAVSLSAAIDEGGGKTIELVQHTPKRDKGPQNPIKKERLAPSPPGKAPDAHGYPYAGFAAAAPLQSFYLPLQNEPDGDSTAHGQHFAPPAQSTTTNSHTFERIQFKSATANNGKRRAQQQYYHLMVELWADIRPNRDLPPSWVKVAQRASASVVVRGRSPSHYQNEGPSASSSRGAPGPGGGGGGGGGPGSLPFGPGPGAGSSASRLHPTLSALPTSFRHGQYGLDHNPASHAAVAADEEAIKSFDGYQYIASTIYSGLPVAAPVKHDVLPPPVSSSYDDNNTHHHHRIKEEFGPMLPATVHAGGCGRFQGSDTSRGLYPEWNY